MKQELIKLTDNNIDNFIKWLQVNEQTEKNYRRSLELLNKWLKDNNIKNINTDTIKAFKKDLLTKPHKDINGNDRPVYKASSVNTYIIAIKQYANYLESKYKIVNFAKEVKKERITNNFTKDSLTTNQVKKIFKSLNSETEQEARANAIIKLMILTGVREIELVRANIEDITTKSNRSVLKVQGKGEKDKNNFVMLYPVVLNAINDYLKFRPKAKGSEPLFISRSNRNTSGRVTTRTIQNIVNEKLKANGIINDRITPHSLRHTAVTLAIINGAKVQEAQAMARHKDINITLRYFNDLNRLSNNAESKLNDLFKDYE